MSTPDAVFVVDPGDAAWGNRTPASCPACARAWLVDPDELGERCGCGAGRLEAAAARVPAELPEEHVPATIGRADLIEAFAGHLRRVRFRDKGLSAPDLADRAVLVWWPRWLVDASVQAAWSAEVGFDYQAQSSVEHYSGGRWVTQKQLETRVRWEPRTGTLQRRYDNVAVPALLHEGVAAKLGAANADPIATTALPEGRVLLPTRSPSEVWAAAEPGFRARASTDVMAATAAQHVRDVTLAPSFSSVAWTVRLHPVWWSWYQTDEGVTHRIIADAVTGRPAGAVMASMRQAWAWGSGIAVLGLGLLLLALLVALGGLLFPPVMIVAALLGVVGVGTLASALAPAVSVWSWNREERRAYGDGA